jgi:hypothetical protein
LKPNRKLLLPVTLLAASLTLAACGETPAAPATPTLTTSAPTRVPTPEPTPTSELGALPTPDFSETPESVLTPSIPPEDTPEPTQAPDSTARELERFLLTQLPPTPASGTHVGGIDGVHAFRLSDGIYGAHSTGMRAFDPQQNHFVGVYQQEGGGWKELARAEVEEPDLVDSGMSRTVEIEQGTTLIELVGGAGAHGGTFHVFQYGGGKLEELVSHSNSIPGAGELRDINGDNTPEAVLDESDAYVFCYACGVRLINFSVERWDGTTMVPVTLTTQISGIPAGASEANTRAITLARGELWKDAAEAIGEAKRLAPNNEDLAWNVALIELTANARRDHIVDSPYPLMARIFYGDYEAAVAGIRDFSPEELFHPQSPLIKGTAAEGQEESLYGHIERTTTAAIGADPNRAGAHFFRGWARWRQDPKSTEAVADLKRAQELAPNEDLFEFVAAYVTNE